MTGKIWEESPTTTTSGDWNESMAPVFAYANEDVPPVIAVGSVVAGLALLVCWGPYRGAKRSGNGRVARRVGWTALGVVDGYTVLFFGAAVVNGLSSSGAAA